MAEMIRLWKIELESKRQVVMDLKKMRILNTQGIIGRKHQKVTNTNTNTNYDALGGSFKQLEFD